jgi:2-phosphosulfolactate phosphatase
MTFHAHAILSGRTLERVLARRRELGAPPPDVVVIVDVLRATTTLVHAFAHGARSARAFADADTAHRVATELPAGSVLLCGERGGLRMPGFDLGNSPREYVSDFVRGRALHVVTTNGTVAFTRTREARRQLAAAFVNAGAVVRRVRELGRVAEVEANAPGGGTGSGVETAAFEAWLVAAGKEEGPSDEDTACALELLGALAAGAPAFEASIEPGDEASVEAARAWAESGSGADAGRLAELLAHTEHGQALIALDRGFARDIEDAARRDAFDLVPEGRAGTLDSVTRVGSAATRTG